MEAQGNFPITCDQQSFKLSGSGNIANNSGNFQTCTLVQNPFTESARLDDWDIPCQGGTVNITMSPFATTTALLTCPGTPPYTYSASPLRDAAGLAFPANSPYGPGHLFNANIHEGTSVAIDQTFTGNSGSGPVTLHLVLTHTPQHGGGF